MKPSVEMRNRPMEGPARNIGILGRMMVEMTAALNKETSKYNTSLAYPLLTGPIACLNGLATLRHPGFSYLYTTSSFTIELSPLINARSKGVSPFKSLTFLLAPIIIRFLTNL